jgi:transposase-like protein
MPRGIPISQEIKNEVIHKIRNEGMSVRDACAKYGTQPKSVYMWLRGEIVDGNRNLILENNRLKKELDTAYRIIGRFTADASQVKR